MTACMAGARCPAGFDCDLACVVGGRAGLQTCFCDPNGVVACENCVVGAVPTCAASVINGQACTTVTNVACNTACVNGVNARCNCVANVGGVGAGPRPGTWRCTQNAMVCM
jgi:hypothetical protein